MKNKGWRFSGNERKYLDDVLSHGFGASESGSMNEKLERKFSELHNKKFAIAANSGTSTLHMALHSFGIGPGDEVIVPALSVAMCGFVVAHCGANIVYADILPDTFLIDPADIKKKITDRTRAIMPVHMYGNMCNMEEIMKIAKNNDLYVVEDCAQCLFASDDKGRKSGTIGHVGSWSFENSKHISTGDGGMVATDDEDLGTKMRQFGGVGYKNITALGGKVRIDRSVFQDPNYERFIKIAYNYRMPELCAAVGLAQLEKVDEFISLRRKMGQEYMESIKNSELFIPQLVQSGYANTYYTFAARFMGDKYGISWYDFRKKYMEFGGDGIYAATKTINNEPCFQNNKIGYGDAPISEMLQKQLMLFTTNQMNEVEREIQINAMQKTLDFFRNH
jgi:perosamine synthetase